MGVRSSGSQERTGTRDTSNSSRDRQSPGTRDKWTGPRETQDRAAGDSGPDRVYFYYTSSGTRECTRTQDTRTRDTSYSGHQNSGHQLLSSGSPELAALGSARGSQESGSGNSSTASRESRGSQGRPGVGTRPRVGSLRVAILAAVVERKWMGDSGV